LLAPTQVFIRLAHELASGSSSLGQFYSEIRVSYGVIFQRDQLPRLASYKVTAAQDREWKREVGANAAALLWLGSRYHSTTPAV